MVQAKNMALLFICCLLMAWLAGCKSSPKTSAQKFQQDNIGRQFTLSDIVDTSGKKITLDFSASEITIIDFWNNRCPPCIEEMKHFPALIKGKASKVSIFSISLSQYWIWKPTVDEHTGAFSFLKYDVPNWKQYNLLTADDPGFHNEISVDRLQELGAKYNICYNPAYFVVDRTGKILARPESAVQYLQDMGL